jgi:hypothetical protein
MWGLLAVNWTVRQRWGAFERFFFAKSSSIHSVGYLCYFVAISDAAPFSLSAQILDQRCRCANRGATLVIVGEMSVFGHVKRKLVLVCAPLCKPSDPSHPLPNWGRVVKKSTSGMRGHDRWVFFKCKNHGVHSVVVDFICLHLILHFLAISKFLGNFHSDQLREQ